MTIKLKCQCCGIEREFETAQGAFKAGWDGPGYFSTHVTCELCPAVCIVLGAGHTKAHEHWAKHGRPPTFNQLCLTDKDWPA